MRRTFRLLVGILASLAMYAQAQVRLEGRVTNANNVPIDGARVTLRPLQATPAGALQVFSDHTGKYALEGLRPGEYSALVDRDGYFELKHPRLELREGLNEIDFALEPLREVFESVEVTATAARIDMDRTAKEENVTVTQLLNVPYPTTNNIRNAMRIMPGVVQDAKGGLHINGAKENQVMYTLDGFNVSDPLTGRFETRLSVESLQSIDVASGRLSAEHGKGSGGTLAIHTKSGDDKFRYSGTNFLPGLENHKGLIIGNWTPRFNFSGPIRRGRAWFSDSFDTLYSNNVIEDLPKGEDRTASWRTSNLLNVQVNLTPSNILYAGFLLNRWSSPRSGLSFMDPRETTVDRRSRQCFFHLKDQIYLPGRSLLEIGYARNRTFGREIPQGADLYLITPDGKRGNYFVDATRKAGRDQFLVNLFLPPFTLAGGHQLKTGLDLNRVEYWQDTRRTGFENYRDNRTCIRRTVFAGNGVLSRNNYEAALYVQDSWRVRPYLLLEAGVRGDWDQILHIWSLSPRLGFAWAPPGLESTKISGGFAGLHDATNLGIFTRSMDQYSLTTYFHPDGRIGRGPALSIFTIEDTNLARPYYRNWSLGWEQQWPGSLYSRLGYLRRRGGDGFTYNNTLGPDGPPAKWAAQFRNPVFDAIYDLSNDRRDVYDSFEVTLRQTFARQYEWMASYTRSRALSNAVVDVNVDDPILVTDNVGRMPWDAPNRFLSWGYLPTFWKDWALAYLLDWRTGYPFSVTSEDGRITGPVNSERFPAFLELNLHAERRFVFRKNRWAFRAGFNNITNRRNPDVVNSNMDSVNFMRFYGGRGRSMNFRIRWLGRS